LLQLQTFSVAPNHSCLKLSQLLQTVIALEMLQAACHSKDVMQLNLTIAAALLWPAPIAVVDFLQNRNL